MEGELTRFVLDIIEEYKDGRIGSYLMLNYLTKIKEKAQEAGI